MPSGVLPMETLKLPVRLAQLLVLGQEKLDHHTHQGIGQFSLC